MSFFRPFSAAIPLLASMPLARRWASIFPMTKKSLIKYRDDCVTKIRCPYPEPKNIIECEYIVSLGDTNIPISIYRADQSTNTSASYPTVFYVPGTSFVGSENYAITRKVCGLIAETSGYQQIVIHHRKLPECPFPHPIYDVFNTIKLLLSNAKQLNIESNNIIISGYSAGGSIAAMVAVLAGVENILFRKQILISPCVDLTGKLDKASKNGYKDKTISKHFDEWFSNLCKISNSESLERYSPLLFPLDKLATVPPADIYCGTNDFFLAHAQAYTAKLREAGIRSRLSLLKNGDHGAFWQNEGFVKYIASNMEYIPRITDSTNPVLVDLEKPTSLPSP